MANGWIKLHRKILECPIVMQDAEHLAIWIYLLASATHKEYSVVFGGERITLMPGQFITGRKMIAQALSISESKVYRVLKHFEIDQQIEIKSNNKASLISIVNWGIYQSDDLEVNTKRTADRTTTEQQVNTKQECKNVKNKLNKNIYGEFSHVKLTTEEYEKLAADYGIVKRDEAIKFFDEYLENNPKYKKPNHNLCIRNWVFNAVAEKKEKDAKYGKQSKNTEVYTDAVKPW